MKTVTDERFVRVWMSSTSLKEVARALRASTLDCTRRATILRKLGVNLPRFTRGRLPRKTDIQALNLIIEEHENLETHEPYVPSPTRDDVLLARSVRFEP